MTSGAIPTVRPPLARKRRRPADIAFHAGVVGAVLVTLGVLAWLLVSILVAGLPALDWSFLTSKTSTNPAKAGFASALRGSIALMAITAIVAIPIGLAAAVHLEKFAESRPRARRACAAASRGCGPAPWAGVRGEAWLRVRLLWARVAPRFTHIVDVNLNNLAAVPSIIYGLLGLAIYVSVAGIGKSLLAGGLTLAVLGCPSS